VNLRFPRRGKDRRLVDLADRNASLLLQKERISEDPLLDLQRILELPGPPYIIEGYDISNTGGQESVGARVVFRHGLPDKRTYRKYRIRSVEGPNDTASLQEVLQRRFSRMAKADEDFPDLVLVDGGKGQLSAARTALESLGLSDLSLVSLAKREEILFSRLYPTGLRLERSSPALRLLQGIRDEAHRFAITYHRRRRTRKSFASLLDGIPGIGPQKKKMLLTHYPGIDDIRGASQDELAALIGRRAAAGLISSLHDPKHKNSSSGNSRE
jgi:excinuclease ABC subunit C